MFAATIGEFNCSGKHHGRGCPTTPALCRRSAPNFLPTGVSGVRKRVLHLAQVWGDFGSANLLTTSLGNWRSVFLLLLLNFSFRNSFRELLEMSTFPYCLYSCCLLHFKYNRDEYLSLLHHMAHEVPAPFAKIKTVIKIIPPCYIHFT
jgi:hypothetical protein